MSHGPPLDPPHIKDPMTVLLELAADLKPCESFRSISSPLSKQTGYPTCVMCVRPALVKPSPFHPKPYQPVEVPGYLPAFRVQQEYGNIIPADHTGNGARIGTVEVGRQNECVLDRPIPEWSGAIPIAGNEMPIRIKLARSEIGDTMCGRNHDTFLNQGRRAYERVATNIEK
jgi:hypothetical protein